MDLPNSVSLTLDELLELQGYDIQKRIHDLEKQRVLLQEDAWLHKVSNRLQIDVRRYHIDVKTGICMLINPEDIKQPDATKVPQKKTIKSQGETHAKLQAEHSVRKQPKGSAP